MATVAYLANQFPVDVEPYVSDEIDELRGRGVNVVASTVKHGRLTQLKSKNGPPANEILSLRPLQVRALLRALVLAARKRQSVADLLGHALLRGNERTGPRLKALLHTALGVYYAALLEQRKINHIHVHHGYFAAWVGMVAARLLGVHYSLTLHGSDLLVGAAYLDAKLQNCLFCVTISDYNRRYLQERFPQIDPNKILVCRLGVEVPENIAQRGKEIERKKPLTLLAVGRLRPVKDHAFLVQACARLRDAGVDFHCLIAGDGPERPRLDSLICENHLNEQVFLLGHVDPREVDSLYQRADVVVLTSRSEGIPLVLMEAMTRRKIVLAPAITGIPELVIPGNTGFLFAPGDMADFAAKIVSIQRCPHLASCNAVNHLDWVRHAARVQVLHNFNRKVNVARFADLFLQRIASDRDFQTSPMQPPLKRMPPARALPDELFSAQALERPA